MPFTLDVLVQGYPGKTLYHGGLGWSTIALLSDGQRHILVDVGSFSVRSLVLAELSRRGLSPHDISHVLFTHAHWDHMVNWTLFEQAELVIGQTEMTWALGQSPTGWHVPELYCRELARQPRLRLLKGGESILSGISAYHVPGHTPGHLCYVVQGDGCEYIFTGDAAKNRVELLSHSVDMTLDREASLQSIDTIWKLWKRKPANVLVGGHDVPMVLDPDGVPIYLDQRRAGVTGWFGKTLDQVTTFSLVEAGEEKTLSPQDSR